MGIIFNRTAISSIATDQARRDKAIAKKEQAKLGKAKKAD
jgi:hypothetical protein